MNQETDHTPARAAPLPFEKTSATRLLVKGKEMFNILMNWGELKVYFSSFENSRKRSDVRYKARLIKDMLMDGVNYMYFVFALPVVQEFEKMNSLFQHTNSDPQMLNNELTLHSKSLDPRNQHHDNNSKDLDEIDYGVKFASEVDQYLKKHENSNDAIKNITMVKSRCRDMLQEAFNQLTARLPPEANMFKNLARLNPGSILNQMKRPQLRELPFQHLMKNKKSKIEKQYRKLPFVDWNMEVLGDKGIPQETEHFWVGVLERATFKEIAIYALKCLVIPVSNATVARVFSLVTSIKTKQQTLRANP